MRRNRAHAPLDGIRVDLDAAVIDEAHEPVPMVQGVTDRLSIALGNRCLGILQAELKLLVGQSL